MPEKKVVVKKTSKRQLEKHLANGKELVHRLAMRVNEKDRHIEALEARIKAAGAYIGYLSFAVKTTIPKSEIAKFIETKDVTWEESEDKQSIIITVKEKEVDPDPKLN